MNEMMFEEYQSNENVSTHKQYEQYNDDSKFFLSAHGSIEYNAPEINLGNRSLVTISGYGSYNFKFISDALASKTDDELREIILNKKKRDNFEKQWDEYIKKKYNLVSNTKILIHNYRTNDMILHFMRDWTFEEDNKMKVEIKKSGIFEFENKEILSSESIFFDMSHPTIQIKDAPLKILSNDKIFELFNKYANVWIGDNERNEFLKQFLIMRAITMKETNPNMDMKFKDIFTCKLSELIEEDIIPDGSLIISTACRGLVKTSFPDGGKKTPDPQNPVKLYHEASYKDKKRGEKDEHLKTDPRRFLQTNVDLNNTCNLKSCEGISNELAGPTSSPDMFCKEQGCLDCTKEDESMGMESSYGSVKTCRSCEQGQAILINCNDDITMCFTEEELIKNIEGLLKNNYQIKDIPTKFSYCDIPAITVAALLIKSDNIELGNLGQRYIKELFLHSMSNKEELLNVYEKYIKNVIFSFKYSPDILEKSFNSIWDEDMIRLLETMEPIPNIQFKIRTLKAIIPSPNMKIEHSDLDLPSNYDLDRFLNFDAFNYVTLKERPFVGNPNMEISELGNMDSQEISLEDLRNIEIPEFEEPEFDYNPIRREKERAKRKPKPY